MDRCVRFTLICSTNQHLCEFLLWQVSATHLQVGFDLHHAGDPAERFVGDINLPEGVPLCFRLRFPLKVMLQSKNHS